MAERGGGWPNGWSAKVAPEVRSYDPTWRDRVARLLMGTGMPTQTVEGLMGSRGLGPSERTPMGMGLVDMTPLGAPLWLNEAERARQSGDMGGQMLNTVAAVPIPGAKVAAQAIGEGVDAAKEGIRVFHGSPHDFDRFDMSKIGTGEGAQAYGHGLYMAENEDVARQYRDSLVKTQAMRTSDDSPVGQVIDWIAGDSAVTDKELLSLLKETYPDASSQDYTKWLAQGRSGFPTGRMYEARINASPDEFLDWDKPLSEQSEKVRDAVLSVREAAARAEYERRGFSPELIEEYLANARKGNKTGGQIVQGMKAGEMSPEFSEALRAAGIKGIRYKDAGSRGKGGEGTNNYVLFSDEIIDIIRKYGIAGLLGTGIAAGSMSGEAKAGDRDRLVKSLSQ